MKILNDNKGNIDGRVHLSNEDITLITTALFYYYREEPLESNRQKLNELKQQFATMAQHMGNRED